MSLMHQCSRFVPFRHLFLAFAILVLLQAYCVSPAMADLVFGGDFQSGTGNLEITDSITFTLTGDGAASGNFLLVLDDIATPDSELSDVLADSNFAFSRNGSLVTASNSELFDNFTSTLNDLNPGDGLLFGTLDSMLVDGESLTLLAGNYSFASNSTFNPQFNGLTFVGDVFIANSLNGRRISTIESAGSTAVPEPGSFALFGMATIGFLARRCRSMLGLRNAGC